MGAAVAPRKSVISELDELTLTRAQRGDEAACRALVVHYQRPAFALLSRMLQPAGRQGLVEDLAQETFLRVFRALARFDRGGPARLSTWILTIATRLALDELRRTAPATLPLETPGARLAAAPERTDAGAERRATRARLVEAVARLSPEQRATFLLREVHELEYDEIARVLEVDLGTVKSRLARARAVLREVLGDEHA
jgi:RNA polymerase sigma factor (sigma-70 family)